MDVARVATMLQVCSPSDNLISCIVYIRLSFCHDYSFIVSPRQGDYEGRKNQDTCVQLPAEFQNMTLSAQNGQILGQSFQPHESHIPFLLQFKVLLRSGS